MKQKQNKNKAKKHILVFLTSTNAFSSTHLSSLIRINRISNKKGNLKF